MSRAVTRSSISFCDSPCFISSAAYSLLYSVPVCGGFDLPSVVAAVTNTLPAVTIGDDHPRPGISCDHSTFSVFDQRSASRACAPTGFEFGPRNCGQALSWPCTVVDARNSAHARPAWRKRRRQNGRAENLLEMDKKGGQNFASLKISSSLPLFESGTKSLNFSSTSKSM